MAEIATLILGADARGLKQGEAALDSIAATGAKTEAKVTKSLDAVSQAMTGTGAASKAAANEALKAAQASNVVALRQDAMAKASGNAAYQGRQLAQQLSQVAQQGAVTGNYLQALLVQLPDMAMGFGGIAIAVSMVATVALPALISKFDGGKSAVEAATKANEEYAASFDQLTSGMDAAKSLQEKWQAAVQSGSAAQVDAIAAEANIREKLIQLDQIDLKQKSDAAATSLATAQQQLNAIKMVQDARASEVATAQENVTAQQKVIDLLTQQRDLAASRNDVLAVDNLNSQIAEATGNYQRFVAELSSAQSSLTAQNKTLAEQQQSYDKASLQWQLIGSQITANNDRLTALHGVLQWIGTQTGNVASGFAAAGSSAYTISAALQDAIGYMSSLQGMINGLDFTNIGLAAQNAALAEGKTVNAANAAGRMAEAQARLNDALKSGDGIVRAAAEAELASLGQKLEENAKLLDQHSQLTAAAKASGGAVKTALDEAAKAAQELADTLNRPVISAVDNVSRAFGDWFSRGLSGANQMFKDIFDGFKSMISDMISTAIANPIKLAMGLTKDAQGNAIPGSGILGSISSGLQAFSKDFSAGFSSFLTGGIGAVKTALTGVTGTLSSFATALGAIAAPLATVALLFSAFRTKTTVLASGLTISMQNMEAIISQFTTTKKSSFFGLFTRTSTSTNELDAATADPIKAVIGDLQNNILGAAKALGVGSDAFKDFAYQMSIDTHGMSKDQAIQAVQEAIAEMGDAFAAMTPGLDALRKLGETASGALDRLASSLIAVQRMTDTLGLAFDQVGLVGAATASKIADAFGGLDAMASATTAYYQTFYSEAERAGIATRQTSDALTELGLTMPTTRDQFRAMIEAQDLTTEAGRKNYAALMLLAGAMDKILPAISSFTAGIEQMVNATSGDLASLISTTGTALSNAKQAAAAWYQVSDGLRGYIADLRGTAGNGTTAAQARGFNEARFQTTLAAALAGSQDAYGQLTGIADKLIQGTASTAHTAQEAATAQARIIADLNKAAGVADLYGGQQDATASLLQEQVDLLTEVRDYLASGGALDAAQIEALNAQLGDLQSALESVSKVNYASILTSMDATVTVIESADIPPALRALLGTATDGITKTLDLIVGTDGLTPEERFIAANVASEHLKTVNLVAGGQLPADIAVLALNAASETERKVNFLLGADLSHDDRVLALALDSELSRTINFALGTDTMTDDERRLALAETGSITRTIKGKVNLSELTDAQRAFLAKIGTKTDGTLKLGASFVWDPSKGFQSWLEKSIGNSIVNPITELKQPMTHLRQGLADLAEAIRADIAQRETSSQPGQSDADKAKALADAEAALATAADARAKAVDAATAKADAYAALVKASTYTIYGEHKDTTITTLPTSFWEAGGLNDQIIAATKAKQLADAALDAARQQVIDLGGIPAFARGGFHRGGLRIVGERGPELEATGPARIYSATQMRSIVGGRGEGDNALVREIVALRHEVEHLREQNRQIDTEILKNVRKSRLLEEGWDASGLPPTRV